MRHDSDDDVGVDSRRGAWDSVLLDKHSLGRPSWRSISRVHKNKRTNEFDR